MSSGIASLHKILKDETRQKIITTLKEKGPLSYTDLMETMGFLATGLLNYHLKALGDLLEKDEAGRYRLTEKGELAWRLITEFPEQTPSGGRGKPVWWRKFWISVGFGFAVLVIFDLALYFLGFINLAKLYNYLLWAGAGVAVAYTIQHITREVLSKRTQQILNKIAYTMLGVWIGLLIAFFGMIGLALASRALHGPNIGQIEGLGDVWIVLLIVFAIAGGKLGYSFGKKRGFRRPEPQFLGFPI